MTTSDYMLVQTAVGDRWVPADDILYYRTRVFDEGLIRRIGLARLRTGEVMRVLNYEKVAADLAAFQEAGRWSGFLSVRIKA